MRLRDIQNILKENGKELTLRINGIANDPNNKRVDNIIEFSKSLNKIEKTGILKTDIQNIKQTEAIFLSNSDSITLPTKESEKFNAQLNTLRNKINIFNVIISEILPDQNENSLSVKLPKIHDLKELAIISGKLDKIFDQLLVNDFVKGESKLQNFDTGSEWIEILFNTTKALGLVVSVIYSVILLKRENIKNQELLEVVRNRKITNDLYGSFGDQLKQQADNLLKTQIQHIMQAAGAVAQDQEYFERIKFCINETSELIDKGLQFFPSSKSPNDIKSKLPDFSKSKLDEMLPQIKQLSENTEETN